MPLWLPRLSTKITTLKIFACCSDFSTQKNESRFGWEKEGDAGGASVAIYRCETKADMYIIAYRGSAGKFYSPSTGKDWWSDDASIGAGRTPDRANDAIKYTQKMQAQYPRAFLLLSGHSLGGYLAQMCGLLCNLPFLTFNAPPALGSWSGKLANGASAAKFRLGLNFRVNWDPVSKLSGSHVGPLETLPHQGLNIINAHGGDAVIKSVRASGWGQHPAMGSITAANRNR